MLHINFRIFPGKGVDKRPEFCVCRRLKVWEAPWLYTGPAKGSDAVTHGALDSKVMTTHMLQLIMERANFITIKFKSDTVGLGTNMPLEKS